MFNNFLLENHVPYELKWENTVKPGRSQVTIRRMRIACLVPKATNTHSGCIILIAVPLQQWLHETHLNVTLYVRRLSCYFVLPRRWGYILNWLRGVNCLWFCYWMKYRRVIKYQMTNGLVDKEQIFM